MIFRNNVLAVKFNQNFSEKVKSQPQKLLETKKNVNLYMNINSEEAMKNREITGGKINLAKSLTNIRPKS